MSDKMREAILPCPFCGGEDIHVLTTGFKKESQGYLMSCGTDKCPASNMSVDGEFCAAVVDWDSEEEAISAWNKRAWQAAQSVPVVGEVVAYGVPNSRPNESSPLMQVMLQIPPDAQYPGLLVPLIVQPTTSITTAELERLWKCAEQKKELVRTMRHLRKTLEKIDKYRLCMSYNDSYFGEPEGTVKRVCSELQHCIDAAIAAEGEGE